MAGHPDLRMDEFLYVVMRWSSESAIDPGGEPTDYVYSASGDLLDVGADDRRTVVGRFSLFYMDVERASGDGVAAFDVFDAYSNTINYYAAIFDSRTGSYSSRLLKLFDGDEPMNRNVLIPDRIEILPKYRGRQIGLTVLRHMIQRFGNGAGVVALKPFPLQLEGGHGDEKPGRWRERLKLPAFPSDPKRATAKLVDYYGRLGFLPMRGTPFMLRSNEWVLPEIKNE